MESGGSKSWKSDVFPLHMMGPSRSEYESRGPYAGSHIQEPPLQNLSEHGMEGHEDRHVARIREHTLVVPVVPVKEINRLR